MAYTDRLMKVALVISVAYAPRLMEMALAGDRCYVEVHTRIDYHKRCLSPTGKKS